MPQNTKKSKSKFDCVYKSPTRRCIKSTGRQWDNYVKGLPAEEFNNLSKMCYPKEKRCVLYAEYKTKSKPKVKTLPQYTSPLGTLTNEIKEYISTFYDPEAGFYPFKKSNFKAWLKRRGYPVNSAAGVAKFDVLFEKANEYLDSLSHV